MNDVFCSDKRVIYNYLLGKCIAAHRWFWEGLSCNDHKHSSISARVLCYRTIPFVVSRFVTPVTCLAYSDAWDLGDWLCRCLTETSGVPLPIAISAMHLLENYGMMKVTLVILWKDSNITTGRCWSDRGSGSMNSNNLLFLRGLLCWLSNFISPRLLLIFIIFCIFQESGPSHLGGLHGPRVCVPDALHYRK